MGAEFVGTFILMFAGTATAIVNQKTNGSETLLGCAASTGLAVMIVILSTGHISGAHLNPAVTIAFAALKHFPWKHVTQKISINSIHTQLIPCFSVCSGCMDHETTMWSSFDTCRVYISHPVLHCNEAEPSEG